MKIVITGTGRVAQCLQTRWADRATVTLVNHKDCHAGRIPDCDILIHAGAKVFADESVRNPSPYIQSNIVDTFRLLEHIRWWMEPAPYLIYLSTVESERCETPYAASKLTAEALIRAWGQSYELRTLIVRLPNLFLPEWDRTGFVGKLISCEIKEPREPWRMREWLNGEQFSYSLWSLMVCRIIGLETVIGIPYTDQEIADRVAEWKEGVR